MKQKAVQNLTQNLNKLLRWLVQSTSLVAQQLLVTTAEMITEYKMWFQGTQILLAYQKLSSRFNTHLVWQVCLLQISTNKLVPLNIYLKLVQSAILEFLRLNIRQRITHLFRYQEVLDWFSL